jgi:hypothetical protein
VEKIALMLPFLLMAATQTPAPQNPMVIEFQKQIAALETATIPDKRLDLFQVEAAQSGSKWDVRGETTVPAARDGVLQAARSAFGVHLGNVTMKLLPDPALGEKNQALVRVSVAPMRKVPNHAAEMVDEIVMGTAVKIIKDEGGWSLVQTPYRYLGWVEKGMLVRLTPSEVEAWTANPALARFSWLYGTVWSQPDEREPISDIVLSCVVRTGPGQGGLTGVVLPDGRTGFVDTDALLPLKSRHRDKPSTSEIVRLALQMRGIPYLWGGNSTKGFDCSGFTQTVFKMNNIQLPRDADQQATRGTLVQPAADFSNIKPGDLLFFGKDRITHVGISLGGPHFIHEGVDVHVTSLRPQDKDFDAGRRDTLKQIRRIVEE